MHHLIADHLDIWTTAEQPQKSGGRGRRASNGKSSHGIQKLRELILELAVRGKLVPQDPNDEPASELLKKIAAEKSHLIKEGEIKKQRASPEVSNEEKPFLVPSSWEWVRIAEVGHDWGQKTPDDEFTYIDVSAIDNNAGKVSNPSILSSTDAPSRARKIVRIGTVIYSTIRPYLQNICVIEDAYSPEPIASTAFAILHPFQQMPGQFFATYLRSPTFVRYVESVQTGIAYPAINDKQFFGGILPLPPVAEQHRIVAKVDELMALCDQLEQEQTESSEAHQTLVETLLATLTQAEAGSDFAEAWQRIADHFDILFTTEQSIDQLKQTILQLAVMGKLVPQDPNDEPATVLLEKIAAEKSRLIKDSKLRKEKKLSPIERGKAPFSLPDGWIWTALNEICQTITQGPNPKYDGVELDGYRVIKTKDFYDNVIHYPNADRISAAVFEANAQHCLRTGDIIFGLVGKGSTGKCNIFMEQEGYAYIYTRATGLIRLVDVELVNPRYVKTVFISGYGKAKSSSLEDGSTGQIVIKTSLLKALELPMPPLAEQHRIVAKTDELMAICNELKARLQGAQATQVHLANAIVEQAVS